MEHCCICDAEDPVGLAIAPDDCPMIPGKPLCQVCCDDTANNRNFNACKYCKRRSK